MNLLFKNKVAEFNSTARMQRTRKHLSKKEKFLANANTDFKVTQVLQSELDGELLIPVKKTPLLINALIDQGDTYVEHAVQVMQKLHDQLGNNKQVVICTTCAKKIGVKRCSQCPSTSTIRYCSRQCQVANWQAHKACCGKKEIVNVE